MTSGGGKIRRQHQQQWRIGKMNWACELHTAGLGSLLNRKVRSISLKRRPIRDTTSCMSLILKTGKNYRIQVFLVVMVGIGTATTGIISFLSVNSRNIHGTATAIYYNFSNKTNTWHTVLYHYLNEVRTYFCRVYMDSQHFNPNKALTQWTICCDIPNLGLYSVPCYTMRHAVQCGGMLYSERECCTVLLVV